MLILAKTALSFMLGFIISIMCGLIFVPALRKFNFRQHVSEFVGERALKKEGTPTMGGVIFIIPVFITLLLLYLRGSITLNHNLIIVLFVFLSYALLGFADDLLKVKFHNNTGLYISTKFLIEMAIALVFFYIYMSNGGDPTLRITFLNMVIPLGGFFGILILLVLTGTANAVNITDGADGLCAGLSIFAFVAYGILSWNATWLVGYQELAIFCFVLSGSLAGFLIFNAHPAKVFMGDLGSLAIGASLAAVAILTRHELSLVLVGGVFVVETLSSMIQIIAIRKFHKKVFLMAPLHHHFEQLGWPETDIIKLFYVVGLILAMIAIIYGVWL